VDFVGSVANVNFSDDQHEGHRGYEIYGIGEASALGIGSAPNIFLLHAGTNDMNNDVDATNALERLPTLIKWILQDNSSAALFVCQIIPPNRTSTQARIDTFNAAIPGIVSDFANDGVKITMVKMNEALTVGYTINYRNREIWPRWVRVMFAE
jgi:lysophospholipase L1-like esterase